VGYLGDPANNFCEADDGSSNFTEDREGVHPLLGARSGRPESFSCLLILPAFQRAAYQASCRGVSIFTPEGRGVSQDGRTAVRYHSDGGTLFMTTEMDRVSLGVAVS
jgi:hypothetical protein